MADQELDPSDPSCLHLVSAFLAMDSTESLISLSRVCGGGSVTEGVQRFIWDHCLSKAAQNFHAPYLKNFLKKLIAEIEDDNVVKGRICKCISFLFPAGSSQLPSCPNLGKLVVPLRCSLNMLDGDTGSTSLKDLYPEMFACVVDKEARISDMVDIAPDGGGRSWNLLFRCEFQDWEMVGSGVGLVGICLAHVEASKVIVSDGDLSTLMNMKLNLESNNFSIDTDRQGRTEDSNTIKCIHLPWESASENELQDFMPDVILGADVIYDPACLPYLVRLLAILLNKKMPSSAKRNDSCQGSLLDSKKQKEEMEEVEVIHSWSAPRSLSTCLMYSFAQRDDMEVLDEPLYAFFLRTTGIDRPYKEELLSKMESDGNKIVKEVIFGPGRKKYRFCKHIAKERLYGLPNDLMKKGKHFILIRNPIDILPSFDKVVSPTFLELGLADLVSIYNELRELGRAPTVIDAADLKRDPEATLRGLCDYLEIPFQDAMLKWEAGPKPVDGIWAPWWYKSVHKSTGFQQSKKYPVPFPFSLYELLEQSLPLYNSLRRHVKQTSSLIKSSLPPPDLPVPANEKLLAWVGDEILPRESAKVSVFDSVVQGGDSVWEGLRVYSGKIFKLDEHLDRLFDSAKALAFINVPTREEVKEAIFTTLIRNGMFDNAHIRLSLTRGKKVTSGMSPAFNLYGCTLIVLPEWKPPVYDNTHGITLVTATTRRNSPNNLDSKIHHNNLLNNILAKIEGNNANADDAIMLDKDGYVSETNATNIFLVKKGHILTPHADYCLPGITRATVMDLVVKEQLVLVERRISLSEFHTADEVWMTGTMGELTPVVKIDGRIIGTGQECPYQLIIGLDYCVTSRFSLFMLANIK
nr:branched-chain-amino-acid aminotransferase-like protein 2 [Quercus suber]